MKKQILIIMSLLTIGLAGCKSDNDTELKGSMEIRKFDSSFMDEGYPDTSVGEVSNTFQEQEELAFVVTLRNEGIGTEEVSWSCRWAVVELYDATNQLIFNTEQRPIGCSAVIDYRVLYAGEEITQVLDWGQELYAYTDDGAVLPTGEHLAAGNYTAVTKISIGLGPRGSDDGYSTTLEQEQTLIIEPAQ
ncbi:hypothetical protein GCM10023150_07610 [Kangiella taiwanensis]|uniref:Intracellular proteinase inhibitor BsuPI domain-containing protein n=3 Tax=Kangiella taiwanensis TaxID=1079179 RepID=A0ABP8HWS0_9GAMM